MRAEAPAAVDWSTPTAAPADLRWQPVNVDRLTTWVPLSQSYGPASAGVGEWGSWSQSPTGAVMAAWTISAYVPDNTALRAYMLDHAITTTEFLDAALAKRPADGPAAPHVKRTPTGFRVDSYTPTQAVISLRESVAIAGGDPSVTASTVKVRWQSGDWRVVYLPDDYAAVQDPPAGSFVAWGPS